MKTIFYLLFCAVGFFNNDLEKRSLLDNKIEILVPKDFTEMSPELMLLKYPGKNRPKLILTNEPGTTNLAFSLIELPADSTLIDEYKESISASYRKNFPNATWIEDGFLKIHGRKVGFFKLITVGIDQKIFNYMFLTDLNGQLLIGSFNCVEKEMELWRPVSEQIVLSLKIK